MDEPVLVVGGTGTAGAATVAALLRRGADVRVLSRGQRPATAGARAVQGDLTTGDGLATALAGVGTVVLAASSGSTRGGPARRLHVDGTRTLLQAAREAGVGHVVDLGIVGIERVPTAYYRVKLEEERVVAAAGLPWTLLRATQFHDLVDRLLTAAARLPVLALPRAVLQPVEPTVVGERLAELVAAGPSGRVGDLGGPRREDLADLARQWAQARGRRRAVVTLPLPGAAARGLREGALCPGHPGHGRSFAQWLAG